MTTQSVSSINALKEYLHQRGATFAAIPHERSFTSVEEARSLGITADEVLKTLVLDTAEGHALAVIPASRRLDMHLVRQATGDPHAHLASEDELRGDFVGYELGAMPPVGSLVGARAYVDPEVFQHEIVAFAAGVQTESVRNRVEDLFRDETIAIVTLAAHPEEEDKELLG